MKRISWTAVILVCLLLIIMGLLTMLSTRCPLPWQCSKLYWQYRGQEGIEAFYVRDYPVDDTTFVDVTLLRATTDSAWVSLCHEFVPYEFADSSDYINKLIHDTTSVTFRPVSKDDYKKIIIPQETGYSNSNIVVLTAKVKSIGIFHINNKSQLEVIFFTIVDNMLHTNNNTLIP